ncbi:hypothetical protein [Massilia sp. SYSU DXS3249]
MHARTIALLTPLLLLAACGGGNGNEPPPDLQGIWFPVDLSITGQRNFPVLFTQTGNDIVLKQCDRSTTQLRFEDGVLLGPGGTPFVMQPAGEGMLLGRRGASAGEELRRYSRATAFESGTVSLALPSLPPLQATQDVCAGKVYMSTAGNAAVTAASVMIAAPYQGSHAEIRLTLPVYPNVFPLAVRTGEFVVRDSAGFLQNPDSSIQVELWSQAFVSAFGQQSIQISTGSVRVSTSGNGVYSFQGSMSTSSGAPVSFSAEVKI